ncbi:MAG: substrate-binding domain-containing protein [Desulfovibrio sp.]|jgi:AI-2 transport system substrate-binding protein|nr:substrate-binding domain-containing protein [Desulfovibrio sp.]
MRKPALAIVCFCLFILLCAGCDSTGQGPPAAKNKSGIVILFIPKVTGNAFFEAANAGVQDYAKKHGLTVEYKGSPQADVANQRSIIEEAIARKVDALCISSLDATALDDSLRQARRAGIKVVTWDSDVSPDARSLMVSQGTPDQLGKMLVEMGAKSLASRGVNPSRDEVTYVWHYSQASVTDQNSWQAAGEKYVRSFYPKWKNLAPENYYSEQDPEKALRVGKQILAEHPGVHLIICNDSTSLPGQAEAARSLGLTAQDVTITGFASPDPMRGYCKEGIIERWGLWDCRVQGALGCYLAYYLAIGNNLSVGDRVDVPDIGTVEVMPNSVLDPKAAKTPKGGVILLPQRLEFTKANVDNYAF